MKKNNQPEHRLIVSCQSCTQGLKLLCPRCDWNGSFTVGKSKELSADLRKGVVDVHKVGIFQNKVDGCAWLLVDILGFGYPGNHLMYLQPCHMLINNFFKIEKIITLDLPTSILSPIIAACHWCSAVPDHHMLLVSHLIFEKNSPPPTCQFQYHQFKQLCNQS